MVGYRPLLLSSISPELAFARGARVRLAGLACLVAIALAVSLAALSIGTILSTALLVGPPAAALRLTRRPGAAMCWAAVLALADTWLGITASYDSFTWPPQHTGWPVSFFVVTLVFATYLLAEAGARLAGRRPRRAAQPGGPRRAGPAGEPAPLQAAPGTGA